EKLELDTIPCLRVYNKIDQVQDDLPFRLENGLCISARDAGTLQELPGMMEHQLFDMGTVKRTLQS
ncbi:MAG: hypothetical protein D3914_00975, partial [Candidatus Electrothrix sp. LOE2]|nr:hypothetical protein [Candidatus Electrothrix sp. LOE2]